MKSAISRYNKLNKGTMKEALLEILQDYKQQFQDNQKECIDLMKAGKEWESKAREGAGIKLMIEGVIREMALREITL